MSRLRRFALALLLVFPTLTHAWWNEDWAYRKKILLNTSPSAAATNEAVTELPVLVRLHTGNFTFLDAKEDGSDLRFVASDEKTPLHYHIEQWDAVNELALVWVRVPRLSAASATEHIWLYFGNKKAQREDDPKQRYDAAQMLDLHFNQQQGAPVDYSNYGHAVASFTAVPDPQGPIGGAAAFGGSADVRVAAAPTLRVNPQSGVSVSAWVRLDALQGQAVVFSQQDEGSAITLALEGGRPTASVGAAKVQADADLTTKAWHHVAMTAGGGKLALFVDGKAAAEVPVALTDLGGDVVVGRGLQGALDEVQVASIARSADWIKTSWAGQGSEPRLVAFGEDEQLGGGGHSYFKILIGAVTLDGWVVIAILLVMMVISFAVMVGKGVFVTRIDKANQIFLERFRKDPVALIDPRYADRVPGELNGSSLFRLYRIGVGELKQRFDQYEQQGQSKMLSPQALGAIKASLDAGMVRESARLNSQMVLLTIAISGGPFLGLLGTVVGVMITFAAIAAVGDVNVNSIAPGIAAALVATVAGLGVAIPALFGYNYLTSRIRNLSNDMSVFADELVTRLAEKYAP